MAQFDVRENTGRNPDVIPYIVEIQADLLDGLATRVVIPLVRRAFMTPAAYLNPEFEIEGEAVVLSTAEIAALARGELTGEVVANLESDRDRIIRAIDVLLAGV